MTVQNVTRPAGTARSGDVVADIVADVVAATRRGTVLYCRSRLHAPWGIRMPAGALASVHVMTAGACWLIPDESEPLHLAHGDVVLIPSGLGYCLADVPGRPVRPLEDLIGGPLGTGPMELEIDGTGPLTGLLCGGYLLAPGPLHPLTAMLPPIVHICAGKARGTGLPAAVDLLAAEAEGDDPGAPAVVAPLIDLLFVYLLRSWLAGQSRADAGWAAALYDPAVGGALALIHANPARPWTVDMLARAVGVPRATFSRRFTTLTGQSPMAYVTAWRMTVAARMLREGRAPLREVAPRVGYDSEFGFARTFKRVIGHAPGRYRAAVEAAATPMAPGQRA
jgi:AraC-like DNA-binding protein